ncbi:MAG TPA: excisionase family DNA-binding protein [Fimbriimonadaceae bacterium]|nr:excisionase family DNA-binding protein [Fimbriimonadaceae bacterium]
MNTNIEGRIGFSDLAPEEQSRLEQIVSREVRPVLLTKGGDVIELPKALNDLLVTVVGAMKRKEAVFLMHESETFTTQAAANFLGVSRQYLVRLLEAGKIPFHTAGTHRRVLFKDLAQYRAERSKGRKAILDRMTETLVEADLYDRAVPREREEPG